MKKKQVLSLILAFCLIGVLTGGLLFWKAVQMSKEQAPMAPDVSGVITENGGDAALPDNGNVQVGQATVEGSDQPSQPSDGYQPVLPTQGDPEHPKAPELDYVKDLQVPPYSGEPYIMLNDGQPFFDTTVLKPESYEIYYDLDELGRCTLADAVCGKDLMPTEKRGSISSVKPTGWVQHTYDKSLVDGESLYNRCHLIAFGLCGEEANKYNLVTGTRYFNTKGINDFENMVIDYIRETNNHVRYRVTPIFTGDNLVCDGQIVEAWSIEDEGDAICFCVYSYNVQPGIVIDYATGENWLADGGKPVAGDPVKPQESKEPENKPLLAEDVEGDFVLNVKKHKIHSVDCEAAKTMSEKNREDYTGSYNALIEKGYEPDAACLGEYIQ